MDTKEMIIESFKKAFELFGDELYKKNYYIEKILTAENEISITYYVPSHFDIFYTLYMKKQNKKDYNGIPKIKGVEELEKKDNPYLLVQDGGNIAKFSDKQYLLKEIYENIKNIKYDDIAFYEKYGILIYNPQDLEGLYNINIRTFTKEG